jgi:hypothetical protein
MTPLQKQCCDLLRNTHSGQRSLTNIASKLNSNRLAIYSSMKALQRQGIVGLHRHGFDKWSILICSLTRKGFRTTDGGSDNG